MHEIDVASAPAYLEAAGLVAKDEPIDVSQLSGGVSNLVLLVQRPTRPTERFVIKQARAQLRTSQPWFARLERAWREMAVLEVTGRLLDGAGTANCPTCGNDPVPAVGTPRILHVDRENYLFAMTAAGPHVVWKSELLAGRIEPRVAEAAAHSLSTLHGRSWRDERLAEQFGDRTLFEELRIDPYYRMLARAHPELRGELDELIASLDRNLLALVHADFSPKNMLLSEAGLILIDFESGHFGDPAFDLGFFSNHLVLKAVLHAPRAESMLALAGDFWQGYCADLAPQIPADELAKLERRMIRHFAGCALARVDGKSPVEYLDAGRQQIVRGMATAILRDPPPSWRQTVDRCRGSIAANNAGR